MPDIEIRHFAGADPPPTAQWPQVASSSTGPGDISFNSPVGQGTMLCAGFSSDAEDTSGQPDSLDANIDLIYEWKILDAPGQSAYLGLVGQSNPASGLVEYLHSGSTIKIVPDEDGVYAFEAKVVDSSGGASFFYVRYKADS